MKAIEFVEGVRESVIDSNIKIYHELFNYTKKDDATDSYWINALSFFNSLNNEQKEVFFTILRQVEVDTVSNLLLILDGGVKLNQQESDFVLTTYTSSEVINGDLQNIFLELEESR